MEPRAPRRPAAGRRTVARVTTDREPRASPSRGERRALILEDGRSRQALAASRALARAGWEVGVGAELPRGIAACSRSTSHDHRVPAPETDLPGFVSAVNAAIAAIGYEIVFGARDVEVLALSTSRDEIDALVPHPPHEQLVRALDKLVLAEAARSVGMASPATAPATEEALAQVQSPVVVKARLHAPLDGVPRAPRMETGLAQNGVDAAERAAEIRVGGGEPLLQEPLAGHLEEVAVVADRDGRLVARVHQEVQRISAPSAGVAVRATTISPDEELMERVAALISELGWWGLAELQFIVGADGEHRLIDFNGRFYGSMSLALGAGVNLPEIWASVATGAPVGVAAARPGIRYQWLMGDLRRCFTEARANRLQTLRDSARWAPGAVQSVFQLRDPLPACRHLALDVSRLVRKIQ